eukprot:12906308-Prorocentrum_lima.AAC.1
MVNHRAGGKFVAMQFWVCWEHAETMEVARLSSVLGDWWCDGLKSTIGKWVGWVGGWVGGW